MRVLSKDINKIAVFRALQLGDMLCAVPALRSLRNNYPNAEICLLGLPWQKQFVQLFSKYVDRFIHFPGYPGLPEQDFDQQSFNDFVKLMQNEQFDLLIQMQGNGTIVNEMLDGMGAKHLAGFHNKDSHMDNALFMEYPNYGAEPDRHLLLMKHLGLEVTSNELEFPITQKDKDEAEQLMLPLYKQEFVCIHPGSRGSWRQWPPLYFGLLADHCVENGLTVVITGTANEIDITREVMKSMKHPAIDLTGKTSLGAIAYIISNAFALIANCTGVSHIASAVKTPSVIISMDGEPERWGPTDRAKHHVIDWTKTPQYDKAFMALESLLQKRKVPIQHSLL